MFSLVPVELELAHNLGFETGLLGPAPDYVRGESSGVGRVSLNPRVSGLPEAGPRT